MPGLVKHRETARGRGRLVFRQSPMGSSISMMLGDVDGDGLEDLILVEQTAGNWFVLYGSGPPSGGRKNGLGPGLPENG